MTRRSKGEGTGAYQLADGRWRAEIKLDALTGSGRRKRKVVHGATKAEANAALREALTDLEAGVLVVGKSSTLLEWLDYWLENIASVDVKARTLAGYRSYIDTWVRPDFAGKVRLEKLRPEHLEQLYKAMRKAGRSETTVLQLHRILSRALTIAVRRRKIGVNPATQMDAPSPAAFEPEVLSTDDARSLIHAAKNMPNGARWMIAVALGLRQGEALALGWDEVDLEAGTLRVSRSLFRLSWTHGCGTDARKQPVCGKSKGGLCPDRHSGGVFVGSPKTESGKRKVALPAPLLEALREHREAQRVARIENGITGLWTSTNNVTVDLVFAQPNGEPYGVRQDWLAWKEMVAAAGVASVRVHDARHTAATVLLAMGVDGRIVMEIMGWSQASMLKRYQHVLDDMKRDAATAVGSALWAAPAAPEPEPEAGVVSMDEFRRRRRA